VRQVVITQIRTSLLLVFILLIMSGLGCSSSNQSADTGVLEDAQDSGTDEYISDAGDQHLADGIFDGGINDGDQSEPPCSGVVVFPDLALEAAIREVIGKPIGDILAEDLQNITHVEFGERGIIHLTGIECLTALESFHVYVNQIVDISPLRNLVALKYIDLDNNPIADISPVSGLVAIERLTMMGDQVIDIGPLVENQGIDSEDYIMLMDNPIDCDGQAANIAELESRGVVLYTDCP